MAIQDNGPRDGDFVRYIEELNAKSAAAVAKAAVPPTTVSAPRPATPTTAGPRPGPTQNQTSQAGQMGLPSLPAANTITTAAIVIGGLAIGIGFLVQSLALLIVLGIALIVWAVRRAAAAKVKA